MPGCVEDQCVSSWEIYMQHAAGYLLTAIFFTPAKRSQLLNPLLKKFGQFFGSKLAQQTRKTASSQAGGP